MNILMVTAATLSPQASGDPERIVWWLAQALTRLGHSVHLMAGKDSQCPFAPVLAHDEKKPLAGQLPPGLDLIHLHGSILTGAVPGPVLCSMYANSPEPRVFHPNTVFQSYDHAQRHGGAVFVHPGIDPDAFPRPATDNRRMYFHFLGDAARQVENVRGAIDLASRAGARLHVIGGSRINFRRGLRITLSPNVRFHGQLAGEGKYFLLQSSRGLLFPALWPEPCGLAAIESLYFGCPVFGTPYGALPELLGRKIPAKGRQWKGTVDAYHSELGCLSVSKSELVEAMREPGQFSPARCQEYAAAHFSAERMAKNYLKLYEKVLNGQPLHAEAPAMEAVEATAFSLK
jgi:glycosyltransferase involved in cell wall biosynthesis